MNRRHIRTSDSSLRTHRAGFTLLEILVAVAAVAIIATGLAAIFDSVGKTVTSGRRVSRINQYGRLLEQQLRNDFSKMTRDGFLVIRQQFADANGTSEYEHPTATDPGDAIALYEDQPRVNTDRPSDQWRQRRVDEILFFKRGDAKSSRVSIGQAGWEQPSSKESMIYYGHGMRMSPEANVSPEFRYENPKVNETNSIARNFPNNATAKHLLGFREDPNTPDEESNPNVYASKWILLRKQTVLIPPAVTATNPPAAFGEFGYVAPPGAPDAHLLNYDCQVGGQPAAPSVFRSLNRLYTPDFDTGLVNSYASLDTHLWYSPGDAGNYVPDVGGPLLSSGIVDIATTSLAEIKSMVMGYCHTDPNSPGAPPFARIPGDFKLSNTRDNNGIRNPSGVFVPSTGVFSATITGGLPYRGPVNADWVTPANRPAFQDWEAIDYNQAWMDNAFPTRASVHGTLANYPTEGDSGVLQPNFEYADADRGVRIRCEDFAPELLNKLAPSPTADATTARHAFYEQADLVALAASNLVVGCSEFSVDWTLGGTVRDPGQIVWYGPQTPCGFYQYVSPCGNPSIGSQVYVSDDTTQSSANPRGGSAAYPYTERLFYGYSPNASLDVASNQYPLSVSSFFGYIDPTYTRDVDRDGKIEPGEITDEPLVWDDSDNFGVVDPGEVVSNPSPSSRRWTWPTMVRIRVTIADPVDPSIESTFEYVFDVPDDLTR